MSRIAVVSSSFHPYVGGVEEHVHQVAATLRARGHEVVIWTVDRGEQLGTRAIDGTLVRYLPTPLPASRPANLVAFARTAPAAYRAWMGAVHADRPELLHVQCFGPNGVYAVALAARTGLPLVVSSHGETTGDDHDVFAHSWQLRAGLRSGIRRAVAVTGCSAAVLADLRGRFGLAGGTVVPNGVVLDAPVPRHDWLPAGAASGAPGGRIVALGRLEHPKGFDLLLAALPIVRESRPTATLRLCGDGSRRERLASTASELGLSNAVTLPGRLTSEQVAVELATADVVVVPSRREAFGMVILEAWRAGTPVVATDRDGPAELIHDGIDGVLVDPTDRQALAAAIVGVLADPAYAARLAAGGRDAVGGFTWDAVAAAYERIYAAALAPPPQSPEPTLG